MNEYKVVHRQIRLQSIRT